MKTMTKEELLTFRFDISLQGIIKDKKTINELKKHNYNGDFIHTLYDDTNKTQKEYIFICTNHYKNGEHDMITLAPIIMQDNEIIEAYEEKIHKRNDFQYRIFDKDMVRLQLHPQEMIDYDGFATKIMPNHQYVEIDGIKYRISEELSQKNEKYTGFKETFSTLKQMGVKVDEMKKDEYMGFYEVPIVYCNGEQTIEKYTISHVDDEYVYFVPYDVPLRNSMNVPRYVDGGEYIVWQDGFPRYVCYDDEEL